MLLNASQILPKRFLNLSQDRHTEFKSRKPDFVYNSMTLNVLCLFAKSSTGH